jgi:IS30 family transposase
MAKTYTHLTLGERERIKQLCVEKHSIGFIATALSRSKSTISLELERNRHRGWYDPERANAKASARRRIPRRREKMLTDDIAAFVKDSLRKEWSPEQISGRMRQQHRTSEAMCISHQSIYRWINRDRRNGGEWYRHLRLDNRKRKMARGCNFNPAVRIAKRVMIDKRPISVQRRRFTGAWEGDTVQGRQGRGRLATLVERKTRYTVLALVESKHAEKLNAAVIERFARSPWLPIRTLTVDNGLEFAAHWELAKTLGGAIYFAHPYQSWQRGLNENTNGLLRQYFPKGCDFLVVTAEKIAEVEELLNNRPRKILGYRTPAEVMAHRLRRTSGVRLVT